MCVCVTVHAPLVRAGFCKQQLWPLFHYILPVSPSSTGRFNSELWQAYVKANKVHRGLRTGTAAGGSVGCGVGGTG